MKHKLNGIFKTNKCPEFYECTDGTFTDKTGKGACSSHGGMLIIGKKTKETPKKPAKKQPKEKDIDQDRFDKLFGNLKRGTKVWWETYYGDLFASWILEKDPKEDFYRTLRVSKDDKGFPDPGYLPGREKVKVRNIIEIINPLQTVFTPEKVQKKETDVQIGNVFNARYQGLQRFYFADNGNLETVIPINKKNQLFQDVNIPINEVQDIKITESFHIPVSWRRIMKDVTYTVSDAFRITNFKYSKPRSLKKIDYTDPKFMNKFLSKISSKNESQVSMFGVYYSDYEIVATDAHKLITMGYPYGPIDIGDLVNAGGLIGKIYHQHTNKVINENYPNYKAVIPDTRDMKDVGKVDLIKLWNYAKICRLLYSYNAKSSLISLEIDGEPYGVNINSLVDSLEVLIKIDNSNSWNLYRADRDNISSTGLKAWLTMGVLITLDDEQANTKGEVKMLIMPVFQKNHMPTKPNGGNDYDRKTFFPMYYNVNTNTVMYENNKINLENNNGINAIFKTNKCPEFYECTDGTFTDKTGKGACSSHGGMLIQGKVPATKKPAKKVKAKPKEVKETRNQIIRPYADLLSEAEGEFNVKYNSYKDNLIVKDATWDNKMIPGSDRSSLIGMEKAKEDYVKDYNFYLKQMNLDLERAGYKKSDLKFKIYTLPKERETPVKPERKDSTFKNQFRDLERGTKIQFKGSWGGGPYFGFVLSKNKYKDRISYDVKRSNTWEDGATSKTPETVASENIISVEEPGPVRLATKPHTFEKTRQPYVSKEAPDFDKILIDAMTTQQQDYLNAPEIKNSTYAHQMRSALLTYYMIMLGLKPGYDRNLFKDSIRRSLKNLRYKEDDFVPLKKAIQYIKEVDKYLEKATPLKLQFTDRFFTKFQPPEKTEPVIVKEYDNSNSLDWKGKKIKIVYDKQTVDSYPYGRKRTTVYFSLEFQPKKGMRTVFQSIDPKTGRLNTPKKSTYSKYMLMYRDLSNDFVHYIHYNPNSVKEWLHFFKRMQEWKIIIPDDITQWLNNEFYMTYLVGLKALVNYSYVGFRPTKEVKEYFNKYAHLLTLFVSDVKKRKEVTEIYNKVKDDDVALYAYIPLLENIEKFAGEYDSLEGAKEYFEPDISKYEKQYEVLKEKYEKEKKLNPPKVKKVVDPTKDRPSYEKTIEEIKEMLEKIVPKFYYKVDRFGKPRWGKDEQSSKRILIQIQLDDKEKPYNGYPQQTDLMLDWETMELKAITQRHSNQKVYLESERFVREGTKIPFRTPKKEWKFVKKAIKKYVETYKKLVVEAIKKGNLYQERDHNGPVVDYTYLTYGESVNGINNIDSYQDQFNNYMQSFKKVPK